LLNHAVRRAGQGRFHMTCFVTILDFDAGTVEFANAGHIFPYVARCKSDGGWDIDSLVSNGPLLGSARTFDVKVRRAPLHVGDMIFWYTDGVPECRAADGKLWGGKAFRRTIDRALTETHASARDAAGEIRDRIVAALSEFSERSARADDITIVVGNILPHVRSERAISTPGSTTDKAAMS
jgi:phosphoserine phosphatase RsbU/P